MIKNNANIRTYDDEYMDTQMTTRFISSTLNVSVSVIR